MTGCSAFQCKNRSEAGYVLRSFPKDPKRRAEWIAKVKRANWKPPAGSRICEIHFEEDQWEKTRADGKRKLKITAVPTLFSFTTQSKKRKLPTKHGLTIIDKLATHSTVINVDNSINFIARQVANNEETGGSQTENNINLLNCFTNSNPTTDDIPSNNEVSLISSPNYTPTEIFVVSDLQNQIKLLQTQINKLETRVNQQAQKFFTLQQQNKSYRNKLYKAKIQTASEVENCLKGVAGVFNSDQIQALKSKSMKFKKWSADTVSKALGLKFACGANGYKQILELNLPFPSVRTLCRRLQNLSFNSGILHEVLNFLKCKVQTMNDFERDCILALDEMSLTPSVDYSTAQNNYIGEITLPEHTGTATHALIFVLGGITTRWKQVIAYYFTGSSTNGSILADIIIELIIQAESIGLRVNSVTSDMAPVNVSIWRKFGIHYGRYSKVNNFIANPADPNRKIFFIADGPHLYKNIKNSLVSNKIFLIPPFIKEKFNLPSNEVNVSYIKDLAEYQADFELKLAPKLKPDLLEPNHFNKMKVSNSTNVISHEVSCAMHFMSEETGNASIKTTAWFLDFIHKWFTLVTSRRPILALSKLNIAKYQDTIEFFKDIIYLFENIVIGPNRSGKSVWKPIQTGVILTTSSLLALQEVFLIEKKYEFLLTSRFTQDFVENIFSQIRMKQVIPTPLQFKQHLKNLCVAQYLITPKGSYESEEADEMTGFLEILNNNTKIKIKEPNYEVQLPRDWNKIIPHLNNLQQNILYNIAGYIFSSVSKLKVCKKCTVSVGSKKFVLKTYSRFVALKEYKSECLHYVNNKTFTMFMRMEQIFTNFKKVFKMLSAGKHNFRNILVNEINTDPTILLSGFPNCHNIKSKLINRFVLYRLKIFGTKLKAQIKKDQKRSVLDSRSMYMRETVHNHFKS